MKGYNKKDVFWDAKELRQALEVGKTIKPGRVIAFHDVCIKIHRRKFFHRDRCLASWKMSQALEVLHVPVPRSLGYLIMNGYSYFLSEFLIDSIHLNDYLSSLTDQWQKRRAVKHLALWLKKIHDCNVWQKDLKSSNILCRNGDYFMVDLEGVKIHRLSEKKKRVSLAQLNASLSNAITLKDRLRFFYYYTADLRPSRRERRAIYRKVWDITKTKNTSVFNLDIEKLKL